jgi:hypothetical protein
MSSDEPGPSISRLLTGVVVGLVAGAFVAMLFGNTLKSPLPVVGIGGVVGGFIALVGGVFDWLAGPPPKKE